MPYEDYKLGEQTKQNCAKAYRCRQYQQTWSNPTKVNKSRLPGSVTKNRLNKNFTCLSLNCMCQLTKSMKPKLTSGHTRIHWRAARWCCLSSSRYIRRNTELNYNLQYRRSLREFLHNGQRFATTIAYLSTSRKFTTLPPLAVRRKPWRTSYERYDTPRVLLATHDEWSPRSCHELSLTRRKPPNAQYTTWTLPIPGSRTIRVCGRGHTQSFSKDKIRKQVRPEDTEPVLKISQGNTGCLKNCHYSFNYTCRP